MAIKLNLGGGNQKIPTFTNIDRVLGTEVYPLAYDDNSVDVIRASHILEHFKHNDSEKILKDWVRALKPGGEILIAVPDFKWIAQNYLSSRADNVAGLLMGGQQDDNDYHLAVFDEGRLRNLMRDVGLVDVEPWESEINDCASQPVSLNLKGRKPLPEEKIDRNTLEVNAKVAALMSVPRLGFQDNFGSCFKALRTPAFDIPLYRFSGAYWEMGIQNGIEAAIEDGIEWLITVDYDTGFDAEDVKELLILAQMYPEADAIVPLQAKRGGNVMLFTMKDAFGKLRHQASMQEFEKDLTPIHTGHFGLTLLKLAALKKMPKPWFWSQPTSKGDWGEGRIDADIYFWQEAEKAGLGVYQANNIRIGHIQVVISWINKDLEIVHQYVGDYHENGRPEFCSTSTAD